MKVKIKKLHPDAKIPEYKSEGASGFDFYALEECTVYPGTTKLIRTGLAFEIPEGFEMQIRMRSSTALYTSLFIPNSPGTVDSDFFGEVKIMVRNTQPYDSFCSPPHVVKAGERIAQGVIVPVIRAELVEVQEIKQSNRDPSGFGSTGGF